MVNGKIVNNSEKANSVKNVTVIGLQKTYLESTLNRSYRLQRK